MENMGAHEEMPQSETPEIKTDVEDTKPVSEPNIEKDNHIICEIKIKEVSELLAPTEDEKDQDEKVNAHPTYYTGTSSCHATPVPKDVMDVMSELLDTIDTNEKEAEGKPETPKLQLDVKQSISTAAVVRTSHVPFKIIRHAFFFKSVIISCSP